MTKIPFIFTFCLIGFLHAAAQEYHVFNVNGPVTIKEKNNTHAAKRGDMIIKSTTVNIGSGAVITVIEKKGSAIIIDSKGAYSFEQVHALFQQEESKVSRFLAYVWEKFHSHHGEEIDKIAMQPIGGVSRTEEVAMLYPPDSVVVLGIEILFRWRGNEKAKTFTLLDERNQELLKISQSDTTFTLYPFYSKLKQGEWYQWTITNGPYQKTNDAFRFFLPDHLWTDNFRNEEEKVKRAVGKTLETEEGKKILQGFYNLNRIIN